LNFCKVEPQKALTSLREWNARNKPPLSETELGIIFQSASRGNYNYGCDDPILKKFCSKGACPFSEKEPIEIRLSDMRAELDTFPVRVKVQVMGESNKKMCCKTVSVECLECGERQSYDLSSPKNYKLLLERLRHGQEGFRRRFQSTPLCDCEKAKRRIRFSGSLDYRLLYCQDVIDPKVKWEEKTYRTERLVLIGEPKEAVLKKVKIEGIVTAFRRDDITILIYKVEPLEKPIPSSTEGFDEYFRNNEDLIEDIDGSVQTYIRGRPIEKLLATLVLHSPYELIYEGERIRGALNDLQLGETKTGKSDILEWIETNVGGEGVRGETARRTGLGFSVDPEAKAIFWGVLPRCDKEVCMIDGLDHFDTEKELPQLREAMAKQILKVSMAVSGVALYRTRIIASANPRQRTFRKYTNMAEAIREFFNDPTLVTRWDFVVPFSREDVKAEEIAKARTTPPKIPLDVFRNHVFWAWNLEPEDIIFKDEAIEEIERLFIELQEYSSDSLPLVHAEYKRVLARVSASYAVLTHNVDELGKVNVTKEHITKAYDLLWGLLEEWEYNLYVAGERKEIEIEGAEWQELLSFLTGDVWKIFSSIANKKGLQRAVLLTMVDKSARTIDSYLDELKKRNLIEHAKGYRGGYQLMDKGIAVYRKMMSLLAEKEEMKNVEQPLAERILRITQIEKPEKGKCNYCGIEAVLCWQIEEFGVRELKRACSDCGQAILARFKEG